MSDWRVDTEGWIQKLRVGDSSAVNELIAHTCERLRRKARKMLKGFGVVGKMEGTDDVLQRALMRLEKALRAAPPNSARHYYNLATTQIRRELIDLARHYGAVRSSMNCLLQTELSSERAESILHNTPALSELPEELAEWESFHNAVGELPDELQEVFGYLWYQRMTQERAAVILDISLTELKRRWRDAKLHLRHMNIRPPS